MANAVPFTLITPLAVKFDGQAELVLVMQRGQYLPVAVAALWLAAGRGLCAGRLTRSGVRARGDAACGTTSSCWFAPAARNRVIGPLTSSPAASAAACT